MASLFVGRSILKPSTTPTASYAVRDPPPCAGPPNLVGRGLCKASKEVYAAPWRMGPAQEWATETPPIERSDRFLSVSVKTKISFEIIEDTISDGSHCIQQRGSKDLLCKSLVFDSDPLP